MIINFFDAEVSSKDNPVLFGLMVITYIFFSPILIPFWIIGKIATLINDE